MTRIYAEITPDDPKAANGMDICEYTTGQLRSGRCTNAIVVDTDDSELKTKYRAYLAYFAMTAQINEATAPLTFAEYKELEEEE